jgi:hypothetical protein
MSESRGGGFDPEQMRRQFGEFWKQTMDQLEDLREAVVKASQTAKGRLDATFLRRERDRLYQQLGEDTYLLIESGKLKPAPALRDTLDRIHAIVEQLAEAEAQEAEDEGWGEAPPPSDDGGRAAAPAGTKKKSAKKKATKKKTTKKKTAGGKKKATRSASEE